MNYYIYAYIRSKDSDSAKAGTPYYIGKGHGSRAFDYHENVGKPKYKRHIVILETNLTELGALALERRLISWWGRIDTGTGILRNKTDGGDGRQSGGFSESERRKMSEQRIGTMSARNIHTGKISRVKVEDYYSAAHLEHVNPNTVPVYDKVFNRRKLITREEFYKNLDRYEHVSKGKITAKNKITGETVAVTPEEFASSSDLVGPNHGKTGHENYNAKKINIFNQHDEIVFVCIGNFKEVCKANALPFAALQKSQHNNSSVPLTHRTKPETLPYVGWYARIV